MRNFIEKLFIVMFCLHNTYTIDKLEDLVFFFLVSEGLNNKEIEPSLQYTFIRQSSG